MRKTAADFDQRILDLFDGYVHGRVSKRDFLKLAGAGGAVARPKKREASGSRGGPHGHLL